MANQSLNSEAGELGREEFNDGGLTIVVYIQDDILPVITVVNFVVVSGILGVFGLVFNIINVIIFTRLGFKDTSNISFLGLSLANAGVVLMLLGCSVVYNPLLIQAVYYVEVADAVGYITFGWSYTFFSRISSGMTAAITVERFLCISIPLKVKTFLTKKVTVVATVTVFVVPVALTTPAFLASSLGPMYNPGLNKTILGLVRSEKSADLENFSIFGYLLMRVFLYVTVIIFTIALTRSFLQKTQWRHSATTSTSTFNNRDKRLVKTVITLSTLFIVLSSPVVILSLMMIFIPEFKLTGRYKNLFITLFSICYPIDGMNSTVAFFIFLDMSSKYRRELKELLALLCRTNSPKGDNYNKRNSDVLKYHSN